VYDVSNLLKKIIPIRLFRKWSLLRNW